MVETLPLSIIPIIVIINNYHNYPLHFYLILVGAEACFLGNSRCDINL